MSELFPFQDIKNPPECAGGFLHYFLKKYT